MCVLRNPGLGAAPSDGVISDPTGELAGATYQASWASLKIFVISSYTAFSPATYLPARQASKVRPCRGDAP